MKKVILGLLAVVFVALLGLFGAASMQPDTVHVERKTTAKASQADVFAYTGDMTKFVEWSPWTERDPDLTQDFSDPSTGVGAWYHWKGDDQVGEGKMTIATVEEPGKVVHDLEFIEPFPSIAQATVSSVATDDGVEITWAYDQDADMGTKMMTLFMDMDAMLGPDFEKGLGYLKEKVEAAAVARAEAEAKAAAEAAAAEAAAAEAAAAEADPNAGKATALPTGGPAVMPTGGPAAMPSQPTKGAKLAR